MTRKACQSAEEYARWAFWNDRIMTASDSAASPCDDCPLDFAAEMRAEGRCDGEPRLHLLPETKVVNEPAGSENLIASARSRRRERERRAAVAVKLYRVRGSIKDVAAEMGLSYSVVATYIRQASL